MSLTEILAALDEQIKSCPWYLEDLLCGAYNRLEDAVGLEKNPPEYDHMAALTDYNIANKEA